MPALGYRQLIENKESICNGMHLTFSSYVPRLKINNTKDRFSGLNLDV
jgi:hypothetical protein